ncbi:hypothetical protein RQP46_002068 [Phenoliferia psychrophenolica]
MSAVTIELSDDSDDGVPVAPRPRLVKYKSKRNLKESKQKAAPPPPAEKLPAKEPPQPPFLRLPNETIGQILSDVDRLYPILLVCKRIGAVAGLLLRHTAVIPHDPQAHQLAHFHVINSNQSSEILHVQYTISPSLATNILLPTLFATWTRMTSLVLALPATRSTKAADTTLSKLYTNALAKLTALESVEFQGIQHLEDKDSFKVATHLPRVRHLNLGSLGAPDILSLPCRIESLNISSDKASSYYIDHIASAAGAESPTRTLEHLRLSGASTSSKSLSASFVSSLQSLVAQSVPLQTLTLSDLNLFTSGSIKATDILFEILKAISASEISTLELEFRGIFSTKIEGARDIAVTETANALRALLEAFPQLDSLTLKNWLGVHEPSHKTLVETSPGELGFHSPDYQRAHILLDVVRESSVSNLTSHMVPMASEHSISKKHY